MNFNLHSHADALEAAKMTLPITSNKISCTECRRRKQKCNLTHPCGRCISRGRADHCVFVSSRRTAIRSRKSACTNSAAVNNSANAMTRTQMAASPALSWGPSTISSACGLSSFESQRMQSTWRRSSFTTENHSAWGGEKRFADMISGGMGVDVDGACASDAFFEKPSEDIFSTFEGGKSIFYSTLVQTITNKLPAREIVETAVSRYFEQTNGIQDTMHRGWFDAAHGRFWTAYYSMSARPGLAKSYLSGLSFAPLLFMVLAMNAVSPRSLFESRHLWWNSRATMACLDGLHINSPVLVMAKILQATFLIGNRCANEACDIAMATVTSAMAIGLNKRALAAVDPLEAEMCRRIWSYCYHIERITCLALGRPLLISSDFVAALPPRNLHDDEIQHDLSEKPLSDITPAIFSILRMKLGDVIGEIVSCCFGTSPRGYSEVLRLDNLLLTFIEQLPLPFQLDTMYTDALDKAYPLLAIQRYILWSELYHLRITLHTRHFILRDLEDRYAFSKDVAVATAQLDLALQLTFHKTLESNVPLRANCAFYRMFHDAVVIGLGIIQNRPSSEQCKQPESSGVEIRIELLNQYYAKLHSQLADASGGGSHGYASTTRKEMEIIDRLRKHIGAPWDDNSHHGSGSRDGNWKVDHHHQRRKQPPSSSSDTIVIQAPVSPRLSGDEDSTSISSMNMSPSQETMDFENDINLTDMFSTIFNQPVDDWFATFPFDQCTQGE